MKYFSEVRPPGRGMGRKGGSESNLARLSDFNDKVLDQPDKFNTEPRK